MPSQTASISKTLTISEHPESTAKEQPRSGASSVVRRKVTPIRRSLIGDFIAIAAALTAVNYLLFRGDPCWLNANPTPLLLLPILIGGRYGSGAGLCSGLFTTAAVFGVMQYLGTAPATLVESHALALAAFPIAGMLCGEIHAFFKAKTLALSERCDELEEAQGRTAANLELYADSNTALQRRLAVHGVRFTSLDSELRRLLAPSKNDLFTDTLALLSRVVEISEAAIYSVGKKNALTREALLGNGDELPEELRADKVEIIDQAIAERQMVTCRDLWGGTPQLFSRHLAAIPIVDPHGEVSAVLVIRRLPFHCVNWQHFAQIETICDWVANYGNAREAEVSEDNKPKEAFEKTAAICVKTHQRHALPSVAVHVAAAKDDKVSQKKLETIIGSLLHSTDQSMRLDGEHSNLAILLPMEGTEAAERLLDEIRSSIDAELLTNLVVTEDMDSPERFMQRLRSGN